MARSGLRVLVAIFAVVLAGAVAVAFAPDGASQGGGVFRVASAPIGSIDPAISIDAGTELLASCAKLMNYVDKPLPDGLRLKPEVAASYPAVSPDGTTFTFTIRSNFRFSTGERVTPASFVREIYRVLDPAMNSPWVQYFQDIVGAKAVLAGKADHASGVKVRGNKLIIKLASPARDFPARVTTSPFCAVPPDLPISPAGVGAPLPSAGPFYIAEFIPGHDMVLKPNPFYSGTRPHHVGEIDVSFVASDQVALSAVESGQADYADVSSSVFAGLPARYRSQLLRVPGVGVRMVVLNSSQPLFRDNVPLRQAVNYAIDRPGLLRERGAFTGTVTDQYMPPSMPGFIDTHIYPLHGGPDVTRARALARGHTRSGRAVLYIQDTPEQIAQSQIIQRDLRPIGLSVRVKRFPGPALFGRLFMPGTPYDMTLVGWAPDYADPYDILNILFDGRLIGTPVSFNLAYFNSAKYNALLDAASRLTGAARYHAYGQLDLDLVRNAAPVAAYENESAYSFVSRRVGCIILNPYLDLAAACLK